MSARPAAAQTEQILLLTDGASMKYFKGNDEPPPGWTELGFDDSSWLDGNVPVGYGETIVVAPAWTVLSDMRNGYLTVYMRIEFEVDEPERVQQVRLLGIQYDDGFAASINGIEVARAQLPAGALTKDTAASSHEFTDAAFSAALSDPDILAALVPGKNIFAVELHNQSLSSSDAIFRPRVSAFVTPKVDPIFVRGVDCDGREELDIGDPIYLLRWRFGGLYPEPGCVKACDMNDDGAVDVSDAVFGLTYLFASGEPFPAPYPDIATDPTSDDLECVAGEEAAEAQQ